MTDQFVVLIIENLLYNKSVIAFMNLLAEWDILHLVNKKKNNNLNDNKVLILRIFFWYLTLKSQCIMLHWICTFSQQFLIHHMNSLEIINNHILSWARVGGFNILDLTVQEYDMYLISCHWLWNVITTADAPSLWVWREFRDIYILSTGFIKTCENMLQQINIPNKQISTVLGN